MAADISAIAYFAPIAAFVLVFIVCFSVLFKTKILGENKWVQLFVSFLIASIFVSSVGTREYVLTVVPWFGVLIVSLFVILFLVGFVGKKAEDSMTKGIGVVFVILMGLIFLVSAFFVFSDVIFKYVPGPAYGEGANPSTVFFLDWLYSSRVLGAIALIVVSAIVSWVLVRSSKGK